ncbi:Cupin 2, conserved barrel domain protein [Candidatus Magnetoovum chiemensis]|nr:Cupin 2, conserved barrel domain protein [Candidatus Magnetoovum chiemensis]
MNKKKDYKTHYKDIIPYITKDGSEIRELMHPDIHSITNLSLAEALIPENCETLLHKHIKSEEVYYIISGSAVMTLDDETFNVKEGDTVCIKPGCLHNIRNNSSKELKILCACSAAYSHDDTQIIERQCQTKPVK